MQTIILDGREYPIFRDVGHDGNILVSVETCDSFGTLYGHGSTLEKAVAILRMEYARCVSIKKLSMSLKESSNRAAKL